MRDKELRELRKFVAPEFIVGNNARSLAGKYIRNFGLTRILLVSDAGVSAAGWTGQVEEEIRAAGIGCQLFTAVSPNPRDHEVMEGARCYRQEHCNGIVAVGGGSVIDCAKGIAVVVNNGGDILDYEGVDMVFHPMPPLIAIPTTAGTGADVSQFAIILDVKNRNKIGLISKTIVPDVALIDPEPTTTMDPFLTACTGMDALTHAVEALCSNAASPLTDVHAEYAIRLVNENLRRAVRSPHDMAARSGMVLGCLEAGLAFSNASLGAVHAMAHSLGGYFDLAHGECNAILLSHVVNFNYTAASEQCDRVAELLGIELNGKSPEQRRMALCQYIEQMRHDVGITRSLGQLGVPRTDLPQLTARSVNDPCLLTNPCPVSADEMEGIYAAAL